MSLETEVQLHQDEGVLRDVLEELDKERTKRAELEAQLRKASDENHSNERRIKPLVEADNVNVSRREFLSMKAQVQGYQKLVEALTSRKPAIAAAHKSSIPLHVLRLLEIMPWDPAAYEHVFGTEELYEWQVFRDGKWQSNFKLFPAIFKALPIVKPTLGAVATAPENQHSKDKSLLVFLAGGDKTPTPPSKHGVLTDAYLTKIWNIEAGYPLPEGQGTWEWIGGWRVEKRVLGDDHVKLDRDEQGWSYGKEAQHFAVDAEMVTDSPFDDDSHVPTRKIRRRKWTRRRILVDYPLASERTRQYLSLLAENSRLSVTVNKVSDQLVETKTALTESEEQNMQLKADLLLKEGLLSALQQTSVIVPPSDDDSQNLLQDFLSKNEQVKELGSKISQWVSSTRKQSEDSTQPENGNHEAANDDDSNDKFDWKKIGSGALLKRVKPSQQVRRPSLKDTGSCEEAIGSP